MSTVTVSASLPLDGDGFLRRACPQCAREFKWRPAPSNDDAAGEPDTPHDAAPLHYFCPYCHEPSAADESWFTGEQVAYMQELTAAEVLGPQLRQFGRNLEALNRPGSPVTFRAGDTGSQCQRPAPLSEPDDMVRVEFPCHPEEPLKIAADWDEEVSCLLCGVRYPADLVRPVS